MYGVLEELLSVLAGFIDTLHVMKAHLPQRKESFSLSALAHLYSVDAGNAHDAVADIRMLEQIILAAGITSAFLIQHSR